MRGRLAVMGVFGILLLGACGRAGDVGAGASTSGYTDAWLRTTAPDPGSSSGSDDRTEDDDPQARADAYSLAWDDACADVWTHSGDGSLYYGGEGWSEDDCVEAQPSVDGTEFADEDDAFSQGEADGYDGAFDLSPDGELCYGPDCWSSSD